MGIQASDTIWHNGELIPWENATVHVLTHALHYGSSVFEGIRFYSTPEGPAGFRLTEHVQRLLDSARIYHMPVPFSRDELVQGCHDVVLENRLESAYVRPILFRGYGTLGVSADPSTPTVGSIAAVRWGAYLGEDSRHRGVDICVSSWNRPAPNTVPAMAKAGGNYLSSQLINMEAHRLGFDEGVALTPDGLLSEGSGENLFIVRDGTLLTPPQSSSILSGITRDTVITLAADLGIQVVEQTLSRECLYVADEIFMTGTAAEITPVRSVDHIDVRCRKGDTGCGEITRLLQDTFFGLFSHQTADRHGWLEPAIKTTQEYDHVQTAVSV